MIRSVILAATVFAFSSQQPAQQPQPPAQSEPCADLQQRAQTMEAKLRDWPQLARYADANSTLEPTIKGERRVVFMGDSITDGWKLPEYFPNKPYVNRGISGQTTPQMLIRFRPDDLDLKPAATVILAGTNDLAGNTGPETLKMIEDNLASMAELARAHGVRVVLASLLPVSDYGTRPQTSRRPPDKIRELNAWMKQYSHQNKLVYLDYFSHMTDDKGMLRAELSEDGLHPNAAGYKIMAPLAEAAIEQSLRTKP